MAKTHGDRAPWQARPEGDDELQQDRVANLISKDVINDVKINHIEDYESIPAGRALDAGENGLRVLDTGNQQERIKSAHRFFTKVERLVRHTGHAVGALSFSNSGVL